jgi:hypothetical protein
VLRTYRLLRSVEGVRKLLDTMLASLPMLLRFCFISAVIEP